MNEFTALIFTPCHCNVLRKAVRHVAQSYDSALQSSGLKTTQYSLLAAINRRRNQPPTMQELAVIMVMDRSTLGHNLRPLERDHLIRLEVSPEDGRSRLVCITDDGRAKLESASKLWQGMQRRFESSFGPDRTGRLRDELLALASTDFSSPKTTTQHA